MSPLLFLNNAAVFILTCREVVELARRRGKYNEQLKLFYSALLRSVQSDYRCNCTAHLFLQWMQALTFSQF